MLEYTVLKPFERHAKGDTVSLNARQAMHLERAGFIEPIKPNKKTKVKVGAA